METQQIIQALASEAGWDAYTTIAVISRWAEEAGLADTLIQHLNDVVREGEEQS